MIVELCCLFVVLTSYKTRNEAFLTLVAPRLANMANITLRDGGERERWSLRQLVLSCKHRCALRNILELTAAEIGTKKGKKAVVVCE